LVIAVSAATATTTTITTVAIIVSVVLLLSCLCLLSFFKHLLLDLLLGLDILVILLQFFPTKLLVLKHVLDQLLNTLADEANIGLCLFRCHPDGAELLNDGLVFLVTEFAFTLVAFASLL